MSLHDQAKLQQAAAAAADGQRPPSEQLADDVEQFAARLLSAEALLKLPPPEPLIDEVLYRDTLAVLYGKPGSFKSFVALDLGMCIALGLPWQGREVRQGPVLYVAAEGGPGLGVRMAAWLSGTRVEAPSPEQFAVYPDPVDLRDPTQVQVVAAWAAKVRPALIVFDTVARSMPGGDENSTRDMGALIDGADRIRAASGAAVLLVHHTGWAGEHERGSSALRGAVATVVKAEADDGAKVVTLRNTPPAGKQRDAEPFGEIHLRADTVAVDGTPGSVVLRAFGRLQASTAQERHETAILQTLQEEYSETGASNKVLRERFDLGESTVSRAVNALARRGAITNEGTSARPRWVAPKP